ncbi:MAG TPA: TonB-dependent receptor, partial [Rhizomicrobium sp.]|nr:TonB-dependent receptor [Rhizomicrobium sp.]
MHLSLYTGAVGALLLTAAAAFAQEPVESITVTAQRLGEARNAIQTQLGASTYTVTAADISAFPGGQNLQFNAVILQTPGVAQDSFGQLHVRGEHAGLQYRLNGVILPEGISVFGQTLDPRLAENVRLIDGALPAEYGDQTGGIVDIQTKTGFFTEGGQIGAYGGSHETFTPSFDYGGSIGSLNYFVSGDYSQNGLGLESPDGASDPLHDDTTQWHGFVFLQDILDRNSSLTGILGSSNDIFQIPNTPGLQPGGIDGIVGLGPLSPDSGDYLLKANGQSAFASESLDERQREITHYGILSYLRSDGPVDSQISFFGRYSSLFFTPGANVGDILYNGIAQAAYKRDEAYGVQAEGVWHGIEDHTVRFGLLYQADDLISRTTSLVLPTDSGGPASPNHNPLCADPGETCQTSDIPVTVLDSGTRHAWLFGIYIQDEWKLFDSLTLNLGVRYDEYSAFAKENQVSSRANLVWKPTGTTTFHMGYSRYFSPPPYENVASTDIALFDNSTAAADHTDTTPRAERADYYDAGVQQNISDRITLGLDSYFKADSDLLDEGQFGAPIILTPFNYRSGRQYGAEFTANYNDDDFSAYFNAAYERAAGKNIVSSEFQFDPGDLDYIATHYIPLDHQQIVSLSGGISYRIEDTVLSTDFLYGSGLRRDGTTPNGDSVPDYITVNLGISHTFPVQGGL